MSSPQATLYQSLAYSWGMHVASCGCALGCGRASERFELCRMTCTVRKPTEKRTEPWCYFFFYFKFSSMMVRNFNDWKKSILWLLISCSFKLLWRLVHIRSHWHSYILSLISRNMFNYDTSLICFYFFSSKYKKLVHEHSIEIYFIQLMSCSLCSDISKIKSVITSPHHSLSY